MPGGYGGSAGGGGGGGDGGGDGGGGGDGEGSAHSSEAHTYSESNPQPVPPHLASCSASVHSRIESASHLALAAACDTAASEQSGLLHDAPFSAQHRTAPVAPPGSAHAVSPGMSLYSLAPIELNGGYGGEAATAATRRRRRRRPTRPAATAAAAAHSVHRQRALGVARPDTYSRSNPQTGPATPQRRRSSASVHSRIELVARRTWRSRRRATRRRAAQRSFGLLHDAPFSAQHRTAPVARFASWEPSPHTFLRCRRGMSLYSLAPIELNGQGRRRDSARRRQRRRRRRRARRQGWRWRRAPVQSPKQ